VHEPPKCKTNTNTDTYYTLHLKTISTDTDYLYSNPPSTLEDDIKKLFNHKIPQWAIPIANKDMYEMKKFISMIRDEQCDIVLDFGANRSIVIHRDLLIARSEYFRSMFNSGMAESDQEVIPMEEEMYDAMNALVEYFYTDRFSTCKTNMMSLYAIVSIYLTI
jgi:S-adenosylhomocysteine hydrolase